MFSSGRHPCLYCHITKDEMKKCHAPSEKRTLETLTTDYEKFLNDGADIKNAKKFNNVIQKYMFDVPLDQVLYFAAQN